jgi:hypothetical protein
LAGEGIVSDLSPPSRSSVGVDGRAVVGAFVRDACLDGLVGLDTDPMQDGARGGVGGVPAALFVDHGQAVRGQVTQVSTQRLSLPDRRDLFRLDQTSESGGSSGGKTRS